MDRLASGLCVVAGIGLIVAALLGPLGFGIIRFHLNRNAIVQYQGGDVVMLAVAAGLGLAAWPRQCR